MKNKNEILAYLHGSLDRFHSSYQVTRIGIFGSVARGQEGGSSDVDVIIEMDAPTFDRYMDLKFELEKEFERPVDLVLADSLKDRLKPVLEKETVYA